MNNNQNTHYGNVLPPEQYGLHANYVPHQQAYVNQGNMNRGFGQPEGQQYYPRQNDMQQYNWQAQHMMPNSPRNTGQMPYYGPQQQCPAYQPTGYQANMGYNNNYNNLNHVQIPVHQNPGEAVHPEMQYSGKGFSNSTSIAIRHDFIRKVFGIVLLQLCVTFSIIIPCVLIESLRIYIRNSFLSIIAMIVAFGIMIALVCSNSIRRSHPLNMILFTILSMAYGIIISYISARLRTSLFFIATGLTILIVLLLIMFAMQTRFDFTGLGPYLFIGSLVLLGFGIALIFIRSRTAHLIYLLLGILLVSFYLIYDVQLIVGGSKHKNELSIDDYLIGALMLYLDIVTLYMYILSAVSAADNQ